MKKKTRISIVAMLFASMIWGLSFVVVKDTLDYITPIWQLAIRLSIASIPALIIAIIQLKKWNKKILEKAIVLGIIFFLALFVQNLGMNLIAASKSAFLTESYVAFVPIIEMLILRRKVKSKRLIAAIVCMSGVALLTLENGFVLEAGDILVLLCGVAYAIHLLYIDYSEDMNPVLMHIGQVLVATVLSLIAAILLEPIPETIEMRCTIGLLYCGIFELFIGFFLQLIGQRNIGSSLAGILLSMESIFAAVFALIFLHENMNASMIGGSILIVGAALINGLQEEPYEKSKSGSNSDGVQLE